MSTYREALVHARSGGTIRCGGKEVRFLTNAEAEPILLDITPDRRVVHDDFGKPLVKDGEIVVETVAPSNYPTKRLGLYDVSGPEPVQFIPTEEEIASDWEIVQEAQAEAPEAVAPETVDATLVEHEEPSPLEEIVPSNEPF